MIINQIVKMKL